MGQEITKDIISSFRGLFERLRTKTLTILTLVPTPQITTNAKFSMLISKPQFLCLNPKPQSSRARWPDYETVKQCLRPTL